MKKEDLFEAIGGLDVQMLSGAEKEKRRHGRRIGWKIAIAAAVIASLAVTAVAAPAVRKLFWSGEAQKEDFTAFTPTESNGNSQQVQGAEYRFSFEVTADEDAPETIQTYYLPQIPEGLEQVSGHILGNPLNSMTQFWWIQRGQWDIHFSQYTIADVPGGKWEEMVFVPQGEGTQLRETTVAGICGYQLDVGPVYDNGNRFFWWCDGQYLFRLEMPYHFTDAQVEEMVASVKPVEDIRPHLSTMTQEELEDVFG